MAKWIYGPVEGPADIRRINCLIRDEMLEVSSVEQLTELKRRSDYLCTLTYSPFWVQKFGPRLEELRRAALEENAASSRAANFVARFQGWEKEYHPFGQAASLEAELEGLDDALIKEIEASSPVEIIRLAEAIEFRREFCSLRKAMLYVDSAEELEKLKAYADFLVTLTYLKEMEARIGQELEQFREAIYKEHTRTVKLANIIAAVAGFGLLFEEFNEDHLVQEEDIEAYVSRTIEEEKRAEIYIPSEARYRQGRVIWLEYISPHEYKGGRRYPRRRVKRIYLPGDAHDLRLEGPGWFTTRFGRKVFGVKLTYKTTLSPTTIHRAGRIIRLPEREIERTKIISLDEGATEIKLLDHRPEGAYPVA
ncbi:hypothetical protein [Thermosulfuriphilus sp.]